MSNRLNAKHYVVTDASPFEEASPVNEAEILRQAEAARALYVGELVGKGLKALKGFVVQFGKSLQQARLMSELAQLDDRTLADIGIRRGDIPSFVSGEWHPNDAAAASNQATTVGAVEVSRKLAA